MTLQKSGHALFNYFEIPHVSLYCFDEMCHSTLLHHQELKQKLHVI